MADMTQTDLRRSGGPLAPLDTLLVDFTDGMLRGFARIVQEPISLGFCWALQAQSRTRQRRRLAEMDDRLLRDIGLDSAQALAEAEKRFWQR